MNKYYWVRFIVLLSLIFFAYQVQAQRKWKVKDVGYVLSPAHCHFYKTNNIDGEKYFTFVYSSKVTIIDKKPASGLFMMNGVWGHLMKVQWNDYKGYIFDGFLTPLYVCRFEDCPTIENAFDANTIREYSSHTGFDCPNTGVELPDSLYLFPECDSIDIIWRTGVKYSAVQTPSYFTQSYVIPKTEVQEIFQWCKLMYRELKNASLVAPVKELEDWERDTRLVHSFRYTYSSNRLSSFAADIRTYDKDNNSLIKEFTFQIAPYERNSVRVIVEKKLHTQLIIKDRS